MSGDSVANEQPTSKEIFLKARIVRLEKALREEQNRTAEAERLLNDLIDVCDNASKVINQLSDELKVADNANRS